MEDQQLKLIHQYDTPLYPDVLFNRPIAGLSRFHIALFGGGKRGIAVLSELYTSTLSMGIGPTCVVETQAVEPQLLPVGSLSMHADRKTKQIVESADILSFIDRSNLAILAPEADLGSSLQILFEKILAQTNTPVIITDEMVGLYRFLPKGEQRPNVLFVLSTDGLTKLANILALPVKIRPGRGVYNIISLVEAVHEATGAHVLSFDSDQAVIRDAMKSGEYGILHVPEGSIDQHRGLLIGLAAGLLAEASQTLTSVLPKLMTVGYLFNAILKESNGLHDPAMLERSLKDTLARELE